MNATQLKHFKELLIKEHDAISQEVRAHAAVPEPASAEVESAIVESDENLLEKINFALGRIDDSTYGTCVRCEGQIPLERLEAKPAVSLCTSCQEEKELLQEP